MGWRPGRPSWRTEDTHRGSQEDKVDCGSGASWPGLAGSDDGTTCTTVRGLVAGSSRGIARHVETSPAPTLLNKTSQPAGGMRRIRAL
jgi:hypothetical protein